VAIGSFNQLRAGDIRPRDNYRFLPVTPFELFVVSLIAVTLGVFWFWRLCRKPK
jgi:hypothetical protein